MTSYATLNGFTAGFLCEVRFTDDESDPASQEWHKARIEKISDAGLHLQVYGGPAVVAPFDLARHLEHDCLGLASLRENGNQCPTCGKIHDL